jgi:hypothetical protein
MKLGDNREPIFRKNELIWSDGRIDPFMEYSPNHFCGGAE